ncbi:MAG: hypothetical protein IKA31_00930, partial [Clostridia bacterium]|nr:hypothetical protein [Clostridia bacterium]
MKNYKRLMILLGIATGVIITLVVLMFTLFGLDKVELKFQNDTTIFADQSVQQNIVKEAEFKKNSCVFFLNKDKYIERIEKNNPYIKVI